jgi:hypothetical protein
MKKIIVAFFTIFISSLSYGQFYFGISPGLGLTGAHFGYQMGKFVPFIGVQNFSGSITTSETWTDFDYDMGEVATNSYTDKFSGGVIMPSIGAKYFFKESKKLRAFGELSITKPLFRAKAVYDGEEDKEFNDAAKSIKLLGVEVGCGVEYFFDNNFSIGGFYGLRIVKINAEDEFETTYYDPIKDEDVATTDVYSVNGNLSPTFTKLTLNFYF